MAEIAVSAAKVLVETVLYALSQMQNIQKTVHDEVKGLGFCLHRLDAYLADMEGNEGTEQLRERVKEVRDVAFHIEDVLEEFMFYVPHRFHRHTISYQYDELAYAAKLWNPFSSVHELLSKITGVKGMIDKIVALDKLGFTSSRTRMEEGSTSGPKPDHQLAPNIPDNGCIKLAQIRGLNYVRSAFLFKKSNLSASAIEHVLHAFKLMRVLDLRDAPLDKFPEAIILLNLLRYLCLRNTKIKEIPNSIKKLSHLETLDLKQTKVTILPEGILQLRNLRHLLIYWYNIKNYMTWHSVVGVKIARGISALTNLQKLSLIKSDKHHEIVKELKALTQLRKLGLVDLKREGGKYLCASVEKMNSPLDALQELPNLLELEMVDAFTGGELVFEAGKFKKLKMLHIEQFELLDTVVVEEGAMPMLQRLSLCKCVKLEMLPLGIDKLTRIEKFGLYDMPVEFTNRLQKTHEDRGMVRHIQSIQSSVLQADGSWAVENLS
ncbi:hypothetical protein RHGRI_009382 [Rhododendron griersonianum]|uniref:Rx N-terminal domain-containing protein n=1 Tax=Rhododendron griersonianum TaxID=479676 RepID=A0AAV6KF72_9ERIC|nr:hypothetical protein RHGRI_009382 [Rhododendron griersonianum]